MQRKPLATMKSFYFQSWNKKHDYQCAQFYFLVLVGNGIKVLNVVERKHAFTRWFMFVFGRFYTSKPQSSRCDNLALIEYPRIITMITASPVSVNKVLTA